MSIGSKCLIPTNILFGEYRPFNAPNTADQSANTYCLAFDKRGQLPGGRYGVIPAQFSMNGIPGKLFEIEIISFDGRMFGQYDTNIKPIAHRGGASVGQTVPKIKKPRLRFRVRSEDKLQHQFAIMEIKKILSPVQNQMGRLDRGFKQLCMCITTLSCTGELKTQDYYAGVKTEDIQPLNMGMHECETDFERKIIVGSPDCKDRGCFYSKQRYPKQPIIFDGESLGVTADMPNSYPERIFGLLGNRQGHYANGGDGNQLDNFFAIPNPICYDGVSCAPLSVTIRITSIRDADAPGGITLYVLCNDGTGSAMHVMTEGEMVNMAVGDTIAINTYNLEVLHTSSATTDQTDILPQTSTRYRTYPTLCPMKVPAPGSEYAVQVPNAPDASQWNYLIAVESLKWNVTYEYVYRDAIC